MNGGHGSRKRPGSRVPFVSVYQHRFALMYLFLAVVLSAAVVTAAKTWALKPPSRVVVQACQGTYGLERCLREQVAAQGAIGAAITCSAKVTVAGGTDQRYLCDLQLPSGAGCYDLVVYRSARDAYPLIEASQQRAC